MSNRVVLVTGGTRGTGEAIVRDFASKGYDVIINFLNSLGKAENLKLELEGRCNVNIYPIKADLSKEEDIEFLVNESYRLAGRIDVLVNNAAIVYDKDFYERTSNDWKETLDVNLIAPFLLSKYIGKKMFEEKSGSIINISSTNGMYGYTPQSIDYDASKAGLINLTYDLAMQFAPYIRVNCVAPGWINTEMNKNLPEEYIKQESERILLKRFADPMEIAKIVSFLASDDSSYINGTIIKANGGM